MLASFLSHVNQREEHGNPGKDINGIFRIYGPEKLGLEFPLYYIRLNNPSPPMGE